MAIRLSAAVLAATLVPLVAGCTGDEGDDLGPEPPRAGVVRITMDDDSCEHEGPLSMPAGAFTVEFVKRGDADVVLELLRIADGVTFDELSAHIEVEDDRRNQGLQTVGYESLASLEVSMPLLPDEHQRVHTPLPGDLEPGVHAFLCSGPSALDLTVPLEVVP